MLGLFRLRLGNAEPNHSFPRLIYQPAASKDTIRPSEGQILGSTPGGGTQVSKQRKLSGGGAPNSDKSNVEWRPDFAAWTTPA